MDRELVVMDYVEKEIKRTIAKRSNISGDIKKLEKDIRELKQEDNRLYDIELGLMCYIGELKRRGLSTENMGNIE